MGKRRSCGHQASGVTGVNLGYRIRVTANDHKRGWAAIATKSGQDPTITENELAIDEQSLKTSSSAHIY
jgi:hypothetical protein